jgi:hypothetical protein
MEQSAHRAIWLTGMGNTIHTLEVLIFITRRYKVSMRKPCLVINIQREVT